MRLDRTAGRIIADSSVRSDNRKLQRHGCFRSTRINAHGDHRELRPFATEIKRARAAAGLNLAQVPRRCGIDQLALSRLQTGQSKNRTLDTLWRYAAAVGRRLVLNAEAIRETGPAQTGQSGSVRSERGGG